LNYGERMERDRAKALNYGERVERQAGDDISKNE